MFKFNLQLFAVNADSLPTNPSQSQATVGKDWLLSVNTGTVSVPLWSLVGGQRGSSLSRKADSVDVSDKTTQGWKSKKAGLKEWSVDLSGLILLDVSGNGLQIGLEALDAAFMAGKEINLKFQYPDGSYRTGWAAITDFSFDNPHDGAATLKGTLEGNGALTDLIPKDGVITLTAMSFSKAAPQDKVFTITPSSTTIASVSTAGSNLVLNTDYTYAAGTLTIKETYLAGLADGVQTFTINTGNGFTLSASITITA